MVDRPVQLQINQSGAWRTALRWNARDDVVSDRILDAADALLRAVSEAGTHAKGRVATDDGLQVAILHWQSDTGWTDTGWTRDR